MNKLNRILLILIILLSVSTKANAQPAEVNPSRVREQFEEQRFDSDVRSRINVKESLVTEAPQGAESIKINLAELKVSGVTVYTTADIEALYAAEKGKTITLADIYAIAQRLTRKYRNDGYILTQVVIPPQTIEKSGIVELRVVEGFISNISVEGAKNTKEESLIVSFLSRVENSKPLNIKDLEHALLLVNSMAGVSARSVLSPSTSKVGGADLLLIIEHKKYEGSLGINNHGSKYLGPVQMSGEVSFNSLFENNEKITAYMVVAPDRDTMYEMFYGSLSYSQPINSYGTNLTFSASNTNTQPGNVLREVFDAKGKSHSLVARLDHPIIRNRDFNIRSNLEFDYTNSKSTDNLGAPIVKDRARVLRGGGSVDFLDNVISPAYTSISVTASMGIDIFNSTEKKQDNTTRPDSRGNEFSKLEAEVMRQQMIVNNIYLLVGAKGQISNGAVLSSEEFGFGGINWGRGYDSSEITGDNGFAFKGELQWNNPVRTDAFDSYSVYAFLDAGKILDDDATVPLDNQSRVSTGLGMRANVVEDVSASALIAFPIKKDVASRNSDKARIFASLSKKF